MPFALRVVISVGLLGFVLFRVEWREVVGALARADLAWLYIAFLTFNCSMFLASERWRLIAGPRQRRGSSVTRFTAVAATYVSLWLSNFLPTAFGGDVARVVAACRAGAKLPSALASAVFDRLLGLTTAVLLFFLVEALLTAAGSVRPLLPLAAALTGGFLTVLVILHVGSKFTVSRSRFRSGAVRFAARSTIIVRALSSCPAVAARVMMISMVATLLGVAAYWSAIRCVSSAVDFPTALAVAVIGTLASAIPISLSGWGVREGAVAVALAQLGGLSPSDAGLIALLNGCVIGATSLVGFGVSVAVGRDRRKGSRAGTTAKVPLSRT